MAEWLRDVSVGDWYEAEGDRFEIVGVDAQAELVLVQHFDGSLEDLDFDQWLALDAEPCAPPEDYSGALDLDLADYAEIAHERAGPRRFDNPADHWDPDTLV